MHINHADIVLPYVWRKWPYMKYIIVYVTELLLRKEVDIKLGISIV